MPFDEFVTRTSNQYSMIFYLQSNTAAAAVDDCWF